MRTVAVVGASVAGWRAAQELREQGFDGRLVIIGAERHRPYERPALSKEFLTGKLSPDELLLGTDQEESDLDAQWRLGERAVALDSRSGSIVLGHGEHVTADGVILTTGSDRRSLPGEPLPQGAHRLHTLDDAAALRAELEPGARLVIVGGGLLGSEVAATATTMDVRVTMVDRLHLPLAHMLGIELAALCMGLHEEHGVRSRYGTPVQRVLGDDRVSGVELADGRVLPADVVLLSVGTRPATDWLRGSGVRVRDGVLTDAGCVTRLTNVVAVGDVARYHCVHRGHSTRTDHWTNAMNQPAVAVRNLLAGRTVAHYASQPYFWSRQYDQLLQFAGHAGPRDSVRIVEGSVRARKFVATYRRAGRVIAVFAMNSPRGFSLHRRRLGS